MNKIYYFTGSGNSLSIAKKIADKLENCELSRVTSKLDNSVPIEADILGFIFPVYSWGMPMLFKEFVREMNIKKADYIFVTANYAGSCGNALGLFQKEMSKKSLKVDAFGEFKMPSNYVLMGKANSQEEAKPILRETKDLIDEFAEKVAHKRSVPLGKVKLLGKFLTATIYPAFITHVPNSDKTFFVTDKCNGCGICSKVCPVDNIILNEQIQPTWQHHCEQCHACFHWCPQKAIEFNKKTSEKQRYTNPDIKVNELI